MIILDKYLFKKVVEILNAREAQIATALQEKDEIEEKLANTNFQADKIIQDAKEEARHIIEDARESVEPEKLRLLELAKKESEDIVSAAKRQGEDVIASSRLKSQEEAVNLLKALVNKAMSEFEISEDAQNQVLSKIINTKL